MQRALKILAAVLVVLPAGALMLWREGSPPVKEGDKTEAPPPAIPRSRNRGQIPEAQLSDLRKRFMPVDRLVAAMRAPRGSMVLDVGAGFGLNTFALASATGPEGRVTATDVSRGAVDFLSREAAARGFTNVHPVQVSGGPHDFSFYSQHVYDVVLVCDVLPLMRDLSGFMSGIKRSIRPGTGRMWVVDLRCEADYTTVEIGDAKQLVRRMQALPAKSPILRRMDAGVREAIGDLQSADHASSASQSRLLGFLNRLLDDESLWEDSSMDAMLDPALKWKRYVLLGLLCEFTAFDSPADDTLIAQRTASRTLNRMIIGDMLGLSDWLSAFALDVLHEQEFRVLMDWWLYRRPQFLQVMSEAGFERQGHHPIYPFHDVWEFSARDATAAPAPAEK